VLDVFLARPDDFDGGVDMLRDLDGPNDAIDLQSPAKAAADQILRWGEAAVKGFASHQLIDPLRKRGVPARAPSDFRNAGAFTWTKPGLELRNRMRPARREFGFQRRVRS